MERRFLNRAPQITFTSDFHELLQGDLRPGATLTLRYDPIRLSLPAKYTFGDPAWRISAHVRSRPDEPVVDVSLTGRITPTPDLDPMGQGSTLDGQATIPEGAQFVELWFSAEREGQTWWDSDHGVNFWFRFPYSDLDIERAAVSLDRGHGNGTFLLTVTSVLEVSGVFIRYSDLTTVARVKVDRELASQGVVTGRKVWRFEEAIPGSGLVRFKLYYWIEGRRYKDDNSGGYYVADRAGIAEMVPAPPHDLIAAEAAWSRKLT